jgi:hypothetical protein
MWKSLIDLIYQIPFRHNAFLATYKISWLEKQRLQDSA